MAQVIDSDALIAALGSPPRRFPPEMTRILPRTAGKLPAAVGGAVFGALLLMVAIDEATNPSKRGEAAIMGVVGLGLETAAAWLLMQRARIRSTCMDVLTHGRATAGEVESVVVTQVSGTTTDRYQVGYADASGGKHTLKAFWNAPIVRVPRGGTVVVLHDAAVPARAAVFPLDYPDLRLAPSNPAGDMMTTLERLGVALDFGVSSPETALMGGVIKAGLYQGFCKLEAGKIDEAIASFDAVLSTAARDQGFASVQAVVHAQRGRAHERKGAAIPARLDYEAALRLDPRQRDAEAGLDRLGRA